MNLSQAIIKKLLQRVDSDCVSVGVLDQCSSTFFVVVHPKTPYNELMHPMLKNWNEAKSCIKITIKTTIALQSALRIAQDRAHNKFKKLSLMTFFLLHYSLLQTIALQSAPRIAQDRAHNKLSLMTFFCFILSTNIPNLGIISFLIALLIDGSMYWLVWLNFFCEIWSHTPPPK